MSQISHHAHRNNHNTNFSVGTQDTVDRQGTGIGNRDVRQGTYSRTGDKEQRRKTENRMGDKD
jgi:hypothetical protein